MKIDVFSDYIDNQTGCVDLGFEDEDVSDSDSGKLNVISYLGAS